MRLQHRQAARPKPPGADSRPPTDSYSTRAGPRQLIIPQWHLEHCKARDLAIACLAGASAPSVLTLPDESGRAAPGLGGSPSYESGAGTHMHADIFGTGGAAISSLGPVGQARHGVMTAESRPGIAYTKLPFDYDESDVSNAEAGALVDAALAAPPLST